MADAQERADVQKILRAWRDAVEDLERNHVSILGNVPALVGADGIRRLEVFQLARIAVEAIRAAKEDTDE